jgi:hypothetical protein
MGAQHWNKHSIQLNKILMAKPTKPKPNFYACAFGPLKDIALEMGYNLVLHGSANRDMDLIAIAWVDSPQPETELVKAMDMYLRGVEFAPGHEEHGYMFSVLPGGRKSYVINLNRTGPWNNYTDEEWYLDISFTPHTIIEQHGRL